MQPLDRVMEGGEMLARCKVAGFQRPEAGRTVAPAHRAMLRLADRCYGLDRLLVNG